MGVRLNKITLPAVFRPPPWLTISYLKMRPFTIIFGALLIPWGCASPPPKSSPPINDAAPLDIRKSAYQTPTTQVFGFSTPETPDIPVNSNDVTDAIEARKHEMADCHARALTKRRTLSQGQISFDFQFSPSGGPAIVKIHESTVKNTRLEQCSLGFMKSLRFRNYRAQNGKMSRIIYPFRFVIRRG